MSTVVMGGFVDDLLMRWYERTYPEAVYGTNWCKVMCGSTMRSVVVETVCFIRMN